MRRSTKWAAVVAVAGAMTFLPAGEALAEERVCRGTIGAATVDNLRVPQDATCTLNGTYVKGTVKVEKGATLKAFGIRVVGNVQAENARKVVVREGSRIGGSVQIVQGGAAKILGNRINGDILFDDQGRALTANRNVIGGNLQAFQNTGGVEIRKNRIDGNLQCKENSPAPVGGGNIVQGNKEDQCKSL
jgi:cytoskeletal protein CcmA (bactofilin family)